MEIIKQNMRNIKTKTNWTIQIKNKKHWVEESKV